jgi:glyoxylase-like metal-dependent hydrolase (beta-lactamase superfamily II)
MVPQRLNDSVLYVPGASNVGLIVGPRREAVLVDSGPGRRSGRQLLRMLEEHGLELAAILNTHCHGDHVGGNAYLVEHTGARVYAPAYDAMVIEHPEWSTMCSFGGAEPLDELRTPRFAPQPCRVDEVVTEGALFVAGLQLRALPLPGHTEGHTGYLVDNVLFTGDILAGEDELANAPVSYAYSVSQRIRSLRTLLRVPCSWYVLGHGRPLQDIATLVERNLLHIETVLAFLRELLSGPPVDAAHLLCALCERFDIAIATVKQYYYWYPVLHAYLGHLCNEGVADCKMESNRLLWQLV